MGEPTEDSHAVPKSYADNIADIANSAKATADSALPKSGGTMTGVINMNGQPISGLNDPTEDTQAARKGYVDAAKAAAKAYTDAVVRKAAPKNLLDNSDFRNPVMQAGFDSLHGSVRYPIDRWYDRYGFGAFTKTDNGITVAYGTNHGYFNQQVSNYEKLSGKKLTLAFCDYDGNIYIASGLWNTVDSPLIAQINADCDFSFTREGFIQFVVTAGSVGLQWAALYEGEYTIDTLPEYHPKGYGAELAECKRYYYRNWDGNISMQKLAGLYAPRAGRTTSIVFPVTMRETPSITLYNPASGNKNCIGDWETDADVSVDAIYVTKHHFMIGGNVEASKMYEYLYEAIADL